MFLDSWLPLRRISLSGYLSLYKNNKVMVYTEWYPLSTKSPIMTYLLLAKLPPFWKSSSTS